MMSCDGTLRRLTESDDPAQTLPTDLIAHLESCARCHALAADVRCVEEALRTYPARQAPVALRSDVLSAIQSLPHTYRTEWHWLPWDVWVPALAVLLALALALMAVPAGTYDASLWQDLSATSSHWNSSLAALTAELNRSVQEGRFWLLWSAGFTLIALVGMRMALQAWHSADASAHQALHSRVADVTGWLSDLRGRLP